MGLVLVALLLALTFAFSASCRLTAGEDASGSGAGGGAGTAGGAGTGVGAGAEAGTWVGGGGAGGDSGGAKPAFARVPSVTREGDRFVISFAAASECDASVWIAGPDGSVVRRLGCGRLGPKAPEPFQRGTLEQRIGWDGKDEKGRPVPAGCSARVGLGLRVSFGRFLFEREQGIESRGPVSLACDGSGNLYVMWGHLWTARFTGIAMITAFDRDGNYLRTVKPFRADWPEEKISAVDWLLTADGRRVPLTGPNNHTPFSGYLPGMAGMARHTARITKDGRYIFVCGNPVADAAGNKSRRLLCIGADGSCPRDGFSGPPLPEASWTGDVFLTLSPDEKYVYVSGTYHSKRKSLHHAVYRMEWKDTAPPKPFAGVECEPGRDNAHFNRPRGLATDPDGRLYVCDYMNDRIQVFDSDGRYLKTLPVTGPEQVAVHPKTREIYVLSVGDRGKTDRYAEVVWEVYGEKSLVKYKSREDFREIARLDFPKQTRYFHDCGPIMAMDASGDKPVIWVSNPVKGAPKDFLWKIVDEGTELRRIPHKVPTQERGASISCPAVAAARDVDEFYLVGGGLPGAYRVRAGTGGLEKVPLPEKAMEWLGAVDAAPDGTLYLSCGKITAPPRDMRWVIRRYGRDGKLVPFGEKEGIETLGYHGGTYAGEKCGPFAVAPDGRIYVSECSAPGGKERARVNIYSPGGELLKEGYISDMTHTAGPLAVDGTGRVYVADAVKPAGTGPGAEFPRFLGADPRGHFRMWYGTVCRFGPEGGAFRHVAPGEKFTHVGGYSGGKGRVVIEGALWEYYGMSPQPQSSSCECPSARLSADGFGRVYVPDVCTHSVQVLDAAGNLLLRFGSYGNVDARGPASAVPRPDIPLRYPAAVAVLDRHLAVADSYNRRVLELTLSYAAEAGATVP
ncbi:MAG: SMP-30/gluconolactonase/LRE family protein [Planctomycetota bacterium]|nr:SMP-30/gluconolactonase/LRE family protein [Planctomycetota bacterium]